MARIRHIALLTKDTEKLSEFYKTAFGLKEVARSGEPSEHGQAIYVSDGHINLAILPARNRQLGGDCSPNTTSARLPNALRTYS